MSEPGFVGLAGLAGLITLIDYLDCFIPYLANPDNPLILQIMVQTPTYQENQIETYQAQLLLGKANQLAPLQVNPLIMSEPGFMGFAGLSGLDFQD